MSLIYINKYIQIPLSSLKFKYSRSSGPGGQNVNKLNTKVTLTWSLADSEGIPEDLKFDLEQKLVSHLNSRGEISIQSDQFRSQEKNKKDCIAKFTSIIKEKTKPIKKRKKTRPSRAVKEQRLKSKKYLSEKKELRKKSYD